MALVSTSYKLHSSQDFLAFIEHDRAGTIVWLRGEHDASTVDGLWDIMRTAIEAGDSGIVIDMNAAEFMGSATFGVIARARESLRPHERSLIVRSPSRCAQRVLDIHDAADPTNSDAVLRATCGRAP